MADQKKNIGADSDSIANEDTFETRVEFVPTSHPTSKTKVAVLTILSGPEQGRVIELPAGNRPTILGRSKEADISIRDINVSRKHAMIVCESVGKVILTDLNSSNGVFVNDQPIKQATLKDNDQIRLGPSVYLKFAMLDEIDKTYMQNLYESAHLDFLTKAVKRSHFFEQLALELSHANEFKEPISILMLDIDHFKQINDKFGHPAGDEVLRQLVALLQKTVRRGNVIGRYGGEEFIVSLKDTPLNGAITYAERARSQVESQAFEWEGQRIPVTISIGVYSNEIGEHPFEYTCEDLVKAADTLLYRAKEGGRNRVEAPVASPSPA